ncbi:zinc-ribbon domain-containing protein [Thermophilibacter sp.]
MNCPNCGSSLKDDARFCPVCGAPIVGGPDAPDASRTMRAAVPERGADEPPTKEQAKESLRRARAAYADARRAAGKSYAPRVVAGVLAAAVVAGAAGGGVWYVMDQRVSEANARADELQAQVDDLRGQLDALSAAQQAPVATTGPDAVADDASGEAAAEPTLDDAQSLVGTWTGALSETSGTAHCYGASETPLEVTIKSVNSTTGQMTLDVSVLFHGHGDLTTDAEKTDGDRVVTFEDLTTTYSESGFTVRGDIEGSDDYVSISFEPQQFSYGVRLKAVAESRHYDQHLGDSTDDTYTLEKS